MTRQKDGMLLAKIAVSKLEGKTQEVIAQENGICRQTVSSYLRSPEAQAIFGETERNTLAFVNEAVTMLHNDLEGLTVTDDHLDRLAQAILLDSADTGGKLQLAAKVRSEISGLHQRRADLLAKIIVGIGAKVIGSGAKVSSSTTKPVQFTPETRKERVEELKQLLSTETDKDTIIQENTEKE
jgi:predicted transcriptional regulator